MSSEHDAHKQLAASVAQPALMQDRKPLCLTDTPQGNPDKPDTWQLLPV